MFTGFPFSLLCDLRQDFRERPCESRGDDERAGSLPVVGVDDDRVGHGKDLSVVVRLAGFEWFFWFEEVEQCWLLSWLLQFVREQSLCDV